jgi:hypothetical protein
MKLAVAHSQSLVAATQSEEQGVVVKLQHEMELTKAELEAQVATLTEERDGLAKVGVVYCLLFVVCCCVVLCLSIVYVLSRHVVVGVSVLSRMYFTGTDSCHFVINEALI